jgi:hypothetical protein
MLSFIPVFKSGTMSEKRGTSVSRVGKELEAETPLVATRNDRRGYWEADISPQGE